MPDETAIQDPQPYTVPSTGFLIEYDHQLYEVSRTACHVELTKDPTGRERHTLDIRVQALWQEDGYQGMETLL
jgi:hypothetical protein